MYEKLPTLHQFLFIYYYCPLFLSPRPVHLWAFVIAIECVSLQSFSIMSNANYQLRDFAKERRRSFRTLIKFVNLIKDRRLKWIKENMKKKKK
jgi:hypothetical protein